MALLAATLISCGVKKDVTAGTGSKLGAENPALEQLKKKEKLAADPQMLKLKNEPLNMNMVSEDPVMANLFSALNIKPEFLRIRKSFAFPIQFNGWFSIEAVTKSFQDCAKTSPEKPVFTLFDDHNGRAEIEPGQRIQVTLEKLYVVRVDIENTDACKNIDMKFSVFYGVNEVRARK